MVKMKELWSLLTMIMVAMLSSSVVSCSGDDDGDGSNSSDSANSFDIVGTWRNARTKSGISTYYADGTYDGSTYSKWELSDGKLYMTRRNNGRIEVLYIEYKDNLLYLTLPDGSATERTVREKIYLENTLHVTGDYFVGKWNEGSNTVWEFLADGRCKYEYEISPQSTQVGDGSWNFVEETQTLITTVNVYTITGDVKGKPSTLNYKREIIYATNDDFTGKSFGFIRVK